MEKYEHRVIDAVKKLKGAPVGRSVRLDCKCIIKWEELCVKQQQMKDYNKNL